MQASWVKMGPERAAQLLNCGCNDMGGSLMNESITRAAGMRIRLAISLLTYLCRVTRTCHQPACDGAVVGLKGVLCVS